MAFRCTKMNNYSSFERDFLFFGKNKFMQKSIFCFTNILILIFSSVLIFSSCKNTTDTPAPPVVTADTTAIEEPEPEPQKIYSWLQDLRVRTQPDRDSDIIGELDEGEAVTYLEEKTDFTTKINIRGSVMNEPWFKVELANGKQGWVYGGGVKFYPVKGKKYGRTAYRKCLFLEDKAYEECVERESNRQLRLNRRTVKADPESGSVTLTLLSGEKLTFKGNKTGNVEDYVLYYYREYVSGAGFHVIKNYYNEFSDVTVVNDKTGDSEVVWGHPEFSQDNAQMVAISGDDGNGFARNGIQVYNIKDGALEKVFEEEIQDAQPYNPIWLDDNTIEITLRNQTATRKRIPFLTYVKKEGNWSLE